MSARFDLGPCTGTRLLQSPTRLLPMGFRVGAGWVVPVTIGLTGLAVQKQRDRWQVRANTSSEHLCLFAPGTTVRKGTWQATNKRSANRAW
ncbi:hypothetical protein BDW68DRAFT_14370 [Aspergillus falconensis]